MPGATIIGTGRYLPGDPVTNDDLAKVMDTNTEWIEQRSGIKQRHYAENGEGCAVLGVQAAKAALQSAGLNAKDIDYIILGTMTPDYMFPGSGSLIGAELGIPGVPALDIRQQCAAFPYGMQVADGLIASGAAKNVLLIGAEVQSGFMPWEDWDIVRGKSQEKVSQAAWDKASRHRGLAVLFGDGAGAFVMRAANKEGHGLLGTAIHSDGRDAEHIHIELGFRRQPYCSTYEVENETFYPRMKGRELFKQAVTLLPKAVREVCKKCDMDINDVDWFIAHQANDRINNAVRDALRIAPDKVPSNIARYGNTSAATIPILTDELMRDGKVKPGQLICFLALGSGLHWGAQLMRL